MKYLYISKNREQTEDQKKDMNYRPATKLHATLDVRRAYLNIFFLWLISKRYNLLFH